MPTPQAICIEDLLPENEIDRYTACVAVPGNEPGLGLDKRGRVLWKRPKVTGCELWISQDERMMLLRPSGAVSVTVRREGRFLDVPFDKPVVLLDQDQVELGGRCFRLHFHGETHEIFPPEPYPPKDTGVGRAVRATAAALAIGVASYGPGCSGEQPAPSPSAQTEPKEPEVVKTKDRAIAAPPVVVDAGPAAAEEVDSDTGAAVTADAGTDTDDAKKKKKKIEVRKRPPKPINPVDKVFDL